MHLTIMDGARGRGASRADCSGLVLFLWVLLSVAPASGVEALAATPPAMDNLMSSQGCSEHKRDLPQITFYFATSVSKRKPLDPSPRPTSFLRPIQRWVEPSCHRAN